MKTVLVSAGALIDSEGRILIAQRPQGKPMSGLWEFPGGKIEPGETPEAALIREIEEELGVRLCDTCFWPLTFVSHTYQDFHLLMLMYICRKWEGIPAAKLHTELRWVRPLMLKDYPMPPADIPLVSALRDALA